MISNVCNDAIYFLYYCSHEKNYVIKFGFSEDFWYNAIQLPWSFHKTMFDQTWVHIYIVIVTFFALFPIILICCWIARVCYDEITIKYSERQGSHFESLRLVTVNGTSTTLLEPSKILTQWKLSIISNKIIQYNKKILQIIVERNFNTMNIEL